MKTEKQNNQTTQAQADYTFKCEQCAREVTARINPEQLSPTFGFTDEELSSLGFVVINGHLFCEDEDKCMTIFNRAQEQAARDEESKSEERPAILRKLYSEIASLLLARQNCAKSGNDLWFHRHGESIEYLCETYLPSGSGIDAGSQLDFNRSAPNRLVITTSYHHMNESGYYDGWTEHRVIVYPSLINGFELKITGSDRNDIKEYLADIFQSALDARIDINSLPPFQDEEPTQAQQAEEPQTIEPLIFSETYGIVSEESASQGDYAETGFNFQDEHYTFKELTDYLTREYIGGELSDSTQEPRWVTSAEDIDFGAGNSTTKSLHPQNDRARRYFWKALRAAGILKAR